jgi:WD40 repeat protein
MSVVGNPRVEDQWAAQQTYPLWKELPTDVTCKHVLPLLDPLDHSRCSVVSKQWNRFLTHASVWEPLSHRHFPSMTPGFFKSFHVYQRLYSNLPKGVCSVKTLQGHNGAVFFLALKDTTLFSGSSDSRIKIWDLSGPTNTCTTTLHCLGGWVSFFALRDTTLFSGSHDGLITIWDLATGTCTATLNGHTSGVLSLALKDTTLFSSSYDATIKIWDLTTNTCTTTLNGHAGKVISSLALKDTTLFSGAYDNTVKIWDLKTKTCTATLEGHTGWICSLTLKDETLFSSSVDNTIKIWDLKTNTCIATLEGHTNSVYCLLLRDAMLFSGSLDDTIKIWDLRTNTCTATLTGHTSLVFALLLKDATLFSGSEDNETKSWVSDHNTLKIWDFAASHVDIFMEIVDALEGEDQAEAEFAIDRFSKMPKMARHKVFHEFCEIIKSELESDDNSWDSIKDAFYGRDGKSATNVQRAEAIKSYLKKLLE